MATSGLTAPSASEAKLRTVDWLRRQARKSLAGSA